MTTRRADVRVLVALAALTAASSQAPAQTSLLPPAVAPSVRAQAAPPPTAKPRNQGPANPLQGFSQNRDAPVKIAAASLEVRDKDKVATFSGDVRLTQGDTTLRCGSLMVFYEQDARAAAMVATDPVQGGQQRIRRLEARGGVHVSQKDQTATGDTGIFDMRANTVTLIGNVSIVRGQDILRGHRLVVDLANGVSRMENGPNNTGRVEGMFRTGPMSQDSGISLTPRLPQRGN